MSRTTLTLADLDGDGDQDAVTSNEGGAAGQQNLSVLFNNGQGTFAAPTYYTVGTFVAGLSSAPVDHLAADLDGDGDPDLVTVNASSDSISVLLNTGPGTFLAAVNYPVGDNPLRVKVGDLDGDGDTDLVVVNHDPSAELFRSSQASILINDGFGAFTAPTHYLLGGASGTRLQLIVADLDRDAKPDILVAYGNAWSLRGKGDGSFEAPLQRGAGDSAALIDLGPGADPGLRFGDGALFPGDLDGDGRQDLVSNHLSVPPTAGLAWGAGDGSFSEFTDLSTSSLRRVDVVADLDLDGDLDLSGIEAFERSRILIAWNWGGRRFSDAVSYSSLQNMALLENGDLSGDGIQDLLVINENLRYLGVLRGAVAPLGSGDCDANGVLDSCEEDGDCDGDGIRDRCEFAQGAKDCNGNGKPDQCDVLLMPNSDLNSNGIPDVCEEVPFRRGDANGDGKVDIADALALSIGAFGGPLGTGLVQTCLDAADADDNGQLQLTDAIRVLGWLFLGGPPPAPPGPSVPGFDPTPDGIGPCTSYPAATPPKQQADVTLGFEGCPEQVPASAGEHTSLEVFATLTTSNNTSAIGPVGWSISLAVEGGTVREIDRAPDLPFSAGFNKSDPMATHPGDPSRTGAVSAVLLSFTQGSALPKDGTTAIARLTVDVPNSTGADCVPVTLRYEDGFKGPAEPVENIVAFRPGISQKPELTTCTIIVCPRPPGASQLPSDANQDSTLDLSDAIWLLGHLFLGTFPVLPCDGGSAVEPGPGALQLLDGNNDGALDISDAVGLLGFLFGGGAPPFLGTECVPIAGCPDACKS